MSSANPLGAGLGHSGIKQDVKKESFAALLWQKEASDIPSKSEWLMFSY